ncbi:hypothetical protein C2845_PM11G11970 [Panicum miliaceum]|uniref:DUF6598 domain-containing protein n=1 Tax=Panicum miliaceum TaxID=4540 RepID=A0A3L6RQZ0_PANMI|nr:hypothetical protein C2845_PM11G11970 [Panicum miliaceum]
MPPTRGISARYDVIVEYSLKVKGNSDETKDEELIDGCFRFKEHCRGDVIQHEVRLFGPFGPLDIRFVYMKYAVEATIEVKVKRAMPGYSLSMVTASTCGYYDEITLYDRSAAPCQAAPIALLKDGGGLSLSVVAVGLGCNLKLRFEIIGDKEEKEYEWWDW